MSVRIRFADLSAAAVAALPNPLEDQWLGWVIAAATRHGWLANHTRPGRTADGWRTAVQGRKGAPDVLLARAGVVRLVELKRNRTYLDPDQRLWAKELGDYGLVWKPKHAVEVEEWLSQPLDGVVHLD